MREKNAWTTNLTPEQRILWLNQFQHLADENTKIQQQKKIKHLQGNRFILALKLIFNKPIYYK